MILSGKEGIDIFCFLRPNVYHATNIHFKSCLSWGFFTNANKCHIINFLLTSLARNAQRNYRISVFLYKPRPPGSVCTKKTWI